MVARQLRRMLDDLAELTMTVDASVYRACPLPATSGSIGEHIRHCLDHIAALTSASSATPLSYDRRERGTPVERDPAEALRLILRLKAAVARWSNRSSDEPVLVTSMLSPAGETVTGWSTLGRELAFVASHTVHHQAIIAMLLAAQSVDVPDGLGYAPSTPRRAV
jgi:uncharacterized damage-inducible protein DinB